MRSRFLLFVVLIAVAFSFLLTVAGSERSWAHCDTMDGPVIAAAKEALS